MQLCPERAEDCRVEKWEDILNWDFWNLLAFHLAKSYPRASVRCGAAYTKPVVLKLELVSWNHSLLAPCPVSDQ